MSYEYNDSYDWEELIDTLNNKINKIYDLEAKLAEKQSKIQELNDIYEDLLCAKGTENELMQVSADCDFFAKENRKLKQQLAEKEKELETYKKQFNEQAGLCEEFRFQLEEKDKEIEKLTEELDDKNFCKDFVDLYSENKLKTQMLHENWKDKISFAVEKLEKVRKTIKTLHGQKNCKIGNSYVQKKDKLYNKYVIELDILEEVLEILDNQIEELKKGLD